MRLVYQFQGQKLKVTRPSNAHTHHAPYFPNGKDYELQTWYTDGGRWPASSTGAMTSKVKRQGCKVTWSVWAILAQCCIYVIRGRQGHTVSAEPGGHTSCCNMFKIYSLILSFFGMVGKQVYYHVYVRCRVASCCHCCMESVWMHHLLHVIQYFCHCLLMPLHRICGLFHVLTSC